MTRQEDAREALAQYDRWRDSINGGTTRIEDMLSTALRALVSATESDVRKAAAEIFTDDGIDEWINHPQNMLSGRTPRQAVADGDGLRVLAIIEGLADGVVF